MEVYFNEVCLIELTNIRYQDIQRLGRLYCDLKKLGIDGCRIAAGDMSEMLRLAREMDGSNPTVMSFLYAFLRQPYESEAVEDRQDDYLAHSWTCRGIACYGLALAYVMDSMTVSTGDLSWASPMIPVERDHVQVQVRNLFDEETLSFHYDWLLSTQPVQLAQCARVPNEKRINLAGDHHGRNELLSFCNRLVASPYVCEIVNSLPFQPGNRRFIHAVRKNGIIEIVLPWTDEGFGVVVKTTGRNMRETQKIAEILKQRFGAL